jgi:formylglycine-generating enzyme required for sulfatase activity
LSAHASNGLLPLPPRIRFPWLTIRVASAFAATALIAIVVQLAAQERTPPVRCPAGMTLFPARCCGVGQTLVAGHCEGRASSCAVDQHFVEPEGELAGCVYDAPRVALGGGKLPAGSADWQIAAGNPALAVAPFAIDRGEVTIARYSECVHAGACEKLAGEHDPGLPVTDVSALEAERFCLFAEGRLPNSAEWRFAAGGSEGRRFPWGYTGLVCRRASFGLVQGPCGSESTGPELVGARPDGATPEGVVDLSGNVAEWTRDPDGRARARGGSYRSRVAAELVAAAVEVPETRAPHVGFRCAYDLN